MTDLDEAAVNKITQGNVYTFGFPDGRPEPPPYDYDGCNDELIQESSQARAAKGEKKSIFSLISASELTAHPVKIHWVLYNFIEVCSLNLLFGEPGSAKAFLITYKFQQL